MSRSARVTSIEQVREFRTKLCEFGDNARDTLSAIDMQIRRTFDWLAERLKYWQREIKVRQEDLTRAKIELEQRKYMNRDGRGPGTADQEKNLRKAQARMKEAEEKVASCKRWHPILEHAVREYYAPARQLSGALDAELVHSLALLEQKLASLEAYLALAPPQVPSPAGIGATEESAPAAEPGAEAPEPVPATEESSVVEPSLGHEPEPSVAAPSQEPSGA